MKCTTWGFRFSIVEPDPGHTKLAVSRSGLNAIARITNPIAVVAVRVESKPFVVFTFSCLPSFKQSLRCDDPAKLFYKALKSSCVTVLRSQLHGS